MSNSIAVIGAGAVGISSAIHLQQRGWKVTLVDRKAPAKALYSLTSQAVDEHRAMMQRTGNAARFSETGWLKVFRHGGPERTSQALQGFAGSMMRELGIDIRLLDREALQAQEPTLKPIFNSGYDLLALAGYDVTLSVERGYHAHYELAGDSPEHSVHDVDGEYIVGPMTGGLRLTTGVELAPRDAPSDLSQLELVEPRLHEAFDVIGRTDEPVWRGARPTLPDSVPVIGATPRSERLWVNFGHQHIGLMTGPVSGKLVAQLLSGEDADADMQAFAPSRWIRRRRKAHGNSWLGSRVGS